MKPYRLALVFTGHMVDLPDRPSPRFPPALEPLAQTAIAERVATWKANSGGSLIGVASGARGGDILFLEACRARGISFRMVLPFAREVFLDTSVRDAGPEWEPRFDALWQGLPPHEREELRLPVEDDDSYAACNRRLLALGSELADVVQLIAYWNGEGDEIGGTGDFLSQASKAGAKTERIPAEELLRRWQDGSGGES